MSHKQVKSVNVTCVRSAEKGAGSQATRAPELYRELDRKRWSSDAITYKTGKDSFKNKNALDLQRL